MKDPTTVEPAGDALHAPRELARRLRALREEQWPEIVLTQVQLGQLLGAGLGDGKPLSVATISSWESHAGTRLPQPSHLAIYARFFATRRSVEGGRLRLLSDAELTDEENARKQELEEELIALRAADLRPPPAAPRLAGVPEVPSPLGEFWRFPPDQDVTIVCSELPQDIMSRMPLADRSSPDYVALYAYADLDALLELHGHIRAVNPLNQVNIRLARELREDDYTSHLILLGGVDWNKVTGDILGLLDLPVTLKSADDRLSGAYFEVRDGDERVQHRALVETLDGRLVLRSDVAHFYRGPNPFIAVRTVTICQALFGRGTLGAVRALTDARFRRRNEEYVRSRFAGSNRFSILTRVPIQRGLTVTPEWTRADVRLHEWPQAAE